MSKILFRLSFPLSLALTACSPAERSDRDVSTEPPTGASCARTLEPGESVQGALDTVASGETICLRAGRYAGGIEVVRGVTLRGLGEPGEVTIEGGSPAVRVTITEEVRLLSLGLTGGVGETGAGLAAGAGARVTVEDVVGWANDGPAIGGLDVGSLVVRRAELHDNTSPYGALAASGTQVELEDCWAHDNEGAGIVVNADVTVVSAAVSEGNSGLGLLLSGGAATSEGSVVRDNGAGGAVAVSLASASFTDDRFTGNVGGAALFLEEVDEVTVMAAVFEDNAAPEGFWAAGLEADGVGVLTVSGGRFARNVGADDLGGGAVSVASGDVVRLHDVVFEENAAGFSGGGALLFDVGEVEVLRSSFVGNTSVQGGGLALAGVDSGRSEDNLFEGNVALAGGAVALYEGTLGGPLAGAQLVAIGDRFAGNVASYGAGYGRDIGCVGSSYHGAELVSDEPLDVYADGCTVTIE